MWVDRHQKESEHVHDVSRQWHWCDRWKLGGLARTALQYSIRVRSVSYATQWPSEHSVEINPQPHSFVVSVVVSFVVPLHLHFWFFYPRKYLMTRTGVVVQAAVWWQLRFGLLWWLRWLRHFLRSQSLSFLKRFIRWTSVRNDNRTSVR